MVCQPFKLKVKLKSAQVAKLVHALALGASGAILESSSLSLGTNKNTQVQPVYFIFVIPILPALRRSSF